MLVLSLISSSYLEAEILKNTNQSLFIAIVDYKFWFVGFFFFKLTDIWLWNEGFSDYLINTWVNGSGV